MTDALQYKKKIKRKIKIIRICAWVCIGLQILGYAGKKYETIIVEEPGEIVGHYIGYNLMLIIALFLFYWATKIRKQLNKANLIDSIGKIE